MNSQPDEKRSSDSRPHPFAIHAFVCALHSAAQSQKESIAPMPATPPRLRSAALSSRSARPAQGGRSSRMSSEPVPASTVPPDQSSRAPGFSAPPAAKLSVRMSSACSSLYRCGSAGTPKSSLSVPMASLAPKTAAAHSALEAVTPRARHALTSAEVTSGVSVRKLLRVARAWCCHFCSSAAIASAGGTHRGSSCAPEAPSCQS
eukprot:scaffold11906_cov70-Phaeocystis_antarctica.AAC.5